MKGSRFAAGASRVAMGLAICACAHGAAWAQDANSPPTTNQKAPTQTSNANAPQEVNTNQAADIVVTAQFRSQTLQSTPLAITAINSALLEARSQTNIVDVASQAPSVTLKPGGGIFGPSLQAYIRGIGQYDNNLGYEPGVGLYVDDVYFSTLTGSALDLLDLDRIEVLRGPQGTLAGKNSIGGAIKLFTKKPSGDNSGYAQVGYGSFDKVDFRGAADFALVPDKLFVRISGTASHSNGYVKQIDYACSHPGSGLPTQVQDGSNCKLGTMGGRSYVGGRIALRWLASDRIEVNVSGDYLKDSSEAIPNQLVRVVNSPLAPGEADPQQIKLNGLPLGNPAYPNGSQFAVPGKYITYATDCNPTSFFGAYCVPNVAQVSPWGVAGTIDWEIADGLSLKSITAYRGYNGRFSLDNDGSPIGATLNYNTLSQKQFTQELRLNGRFGKLIDYTVGGFYLDAHDHNGGRVDISYIAPTFGQLLDDPVVNKSEAAFFQGIAHLTDRLNFTGGIRYTHESKAYTYGRLSQAGDGTVAIPTGLGVNGQTGRYSGNRVDYRANLDYQVTNDILGYAQFSTGFKGGGTNPRPFFATQLFGFGPETLDSYEVGLKTRFFDHHLRLNLAGFYSDYKDIQLVLLVCPDGSVPCAGPQNVGNAHIKGVEAEFDAQPFKGFSIDGSASYTDFKYYKFTSATAVGFNDRAPFTPKWKWSIGAQYTGQLGGGYTLTPRIDGSYQGTLFTDPVNTVNNRIPAYTLWNARLTLSSLEARWQLALQVTNLFNKFYYSSLSDNVAFLGIEFGTPGRPREYGLQLKHTF